MNNNDCHVTPLVVTLATSDDNIFSESTGFSWKGDLYWAVDCLVHLQTSVSENIIPNIPQNVYQKIDKLPTDPWDFCKFKQNCSREDDRLLIVFTFNPSSTNPFDYSQFIINTHCDVTYRSKNILKDSQSRDILLDIDKVSKPTTKPFVDIWLTIDPEKTHFNSNAITINNIKQKTNYLILIIFVIFLLIFISLLLFYIFYNKIIIV